MFLVPKIFDPYFKTEHTDDHSAKFCGNQPTELGDLMAGKKECQQNITLVRNYHFRAD